jgi:hypothetical protein
MTVFYSHHNSAHHFNFIQPNNYIREHMHHGANHRHPLKILLVVTALLMLFGFILSWDIIAKN